MRHSVAITLSLALAGSAIAFAGLAPANAVEDREQEVSIAVDGSASSGDLEGAFVSIVVSDGDPSTPQADPVFTVDGEEIPAGSVITGGVADESGILDVVLPPGDYSIVSSMSGFQPESVTVNVPVSDDNDRAPQVAPVVLEDNNRPMSYVSAFGGQMTAVVADGEPGVFYATTSSIPSFYRSTDHGGTWAPVAQASDAQSAEGESTDFKGLDGTSTISEIATSGYPGEVAVIISSNSPSSPGRTLWYSRDFGTTWQSKSLLGINSVRDLQWAHAYDEASNQHSSYAFILTGNAEAPARAMWVAAMPSGTAGSADDPMAAATITLFELGDAASYLTSSTDLISVKPGADSVFVAVQKGAAGTAIAELPKAAASSGLAPSNAVGSVSLSDLTRTAQTGSGNFLNSTDLLLFGGPLNASTGSPSSLFVYNRTGATRNSSRAAVMAAQLGDDGTWSSATSSMAAYQPQMQQFSQLSEIGGQGPTATNCGENETTPVGSNSPIFAGSGDATHWAGFGSMAMARSCLLVLATDDTTLPTRVEPMNPMSAVENTAIMAGTIVVIPVSGANNNTGSAFSAGFDLRNDSVVISGDGARGLVKSATFADGVQGPMDQGGRLVKQLSERYGYSPLFPEAAHVAMNYIKNRADAGTAQTSGGFAIHGISSPTVRDVHPSPSDSDGMLMGFSFTGGGRTVLSADGGKAWYTIGGGGSNAVAWWTNADGDQWLAGGSSGNSNDAFFSARRITPGYWSSYKAAIAAGADPDAPDYAGDRILFDMPIGSGGAGGAFGAGNFSLVGGELSGLAGITGTDKVLVGASSNGGSGVALASLTQSAENSGSVSLTGVKYVQGSGPYTWANSASSALVSGLRIVSMAYCPAVTVDPSVNEAVADTAFVAFGPDMGGSGGKVLRIDGIKAGSPVVSNVDMSGDSNSVKDLKVDCGAGAVVIGYSTTQPSSTPHLRAAVPDEATGELTPLEPIAIAPMDPSEPMPANIKQVETVAVETDPATGETKIVVVSQSGDVMGVDTSLDKLAEGLPADGEIVNDSSDPSGFSFGGEKPGDIEFPTQEAEIVAQGGSGQSAQLRARLPRAATPPAAPLLGAGAGALTTELAAPAVVVTRPGAPDSVRVVAKWNGQAKKGQLTISWTPPTVTGGAGITGYKIRWKAGSGAWSSWASRGAAVRQMETPANLLSGTTYNVEVLAVNSAGDGIARAGSAVTAGVPAAPRTPKATVTGKSPNASVKFTWLAPSSNGGSAVTGYNVYVKKGNAWTKLNTTPVGGLSFTKAGFKSGTVSFRIEAVNAVGAGASLTGNVTVK